jgi:hypothetical protein
MLLQTKKDGKNAKSVTSKEFEAIMKHFMEKAETVAEVFSDYFEGQEPLFAFDHASCHDAADLASIGLLEDQLHPVPVCSPDFQKPIEHVFGRLAKQFQNLLYNKSMAELGTPAQYRNAVLSIFESMPTMHIKHDVKSLRNLYRVVKTPTAHGGVEGDWPPQEYT